MNRSTAEQPPAGGEGPIRTFICIEIPEAVRERIAALQHDLKQTGASVSWTKPSNIHLTIKFLGDIAQPQIESVKRAVERACRPINQFEIEVGGTGCFPSPRSPRVLWVGLTRMPDTLKRLRSAVEGELAAEGFARELKSFSPHLTLGRLRSGQNASLLAQQLIDQGFEPHSFIAGEVIVMRSDLRPGGSVYTPQARIKLAP